MSKSAHKCILYNNVCAQNFIQMVEIWQYENKNLFCSKNRERSSVGLAVDKKNQVLFYRLYWSKSGQVEKSFYQLLK